MDGVPTMGRNTQGVRLMELDPDERIVSVARVAEREEDAVEADVPAAEA
jgi:DNA gyrase subunit A